MIGYLVCTILGTLVYVRRRKVWNRQEVKWAIPNLRVVARSGTSVLNVSSIQNWNHRNMTSLFADERSREGSGMGVGVTRDETSREVVIPYLIQRPKSDHQSECTLDEQTLNLYPPFSIEFS